VTEKLARGYEFVWLVILGRAQTGYKQVKKGKLKTLTKNDGG